MDKYFSDRVMAAIEAETARREQRSERMMYWLVGVCIAFLAVAVTWGMFYFGVFGKIKEGFLQTLPAFQISDTFVPSWNPVWLIVLVNGAILISIYMYFEKKFTVK